MIEFSFQKVFFYVFTRILGCLVPRHRLPHHSLWQQQKKSCCVAATSSSSLFSTKGLKAATSVTLCGVPHLRHANQ
jgi:hypothetical protein